MFGNSPEILVLVFLKGNGGRVDLGGEIEEGTYRNGGKENSSQVVIYERR